MKRIHLLLFMGVFTMIIHTTVSAQTKIVTTGNNLVNTADPYAADVVIGSDLNGGTRHDASIMWWSNSSASRISNTLDVFYISQWNTTNTNIGLAAAFGGSSFFNGNVGIGTITPNVPLHVVAHSAPLTEMPMEKWDPNINGYNLVLSNYNSSHGIDYRFTQLHAGSPIQVLTFQAGNVGIGTVNPDTKLAVKGTIHASEVKVDLNVPQPDYVFDKGYDLHSLADVKTYIDQHHHLPEIPSAAQAARDGINLGEMNTKLLKKIEELTLYLIEKDEKEGIQKETIEAQGRRIGKLEQQLDQFINRGNKSVKHKN